LEPDEITYLKPYPEEIAIASQIR